jgi:NNMT/PNMT/TEMT family
MTLSAFDTAAFSARMYNESYFSTVMQDEKVLLDWLATSAVAHLNDADTNPRRDGRRSLLDVGSGPTVHHMLSLCREADEIVVSDYLADNLAEIQLWLDEGYGAHDWTPFTMDILCAEGTTPTPAEIRKRESLLRAKVKQLAFIDLRSPRPLCSAIPSGALFEQTRFDVVTSFYCADSATPCKEEFRRMIAHMATLVAEGGSFIGSFLGGCRAYSVGTRWLPSANLDANDIASALRQGGLRMNELTCLETPDLEDHGFDHIYVTAASNVADRPTR